MINFILNNTLPTLIPAAKSKSTDFLAYLENEDNPIISDPLLANQSTMSVPLENPTSDFFLLLKDTLKEQGESQNSPSSVIVNGSKKTIQALYHQEVNHLDNTGECEKIAHLEKIPTLEKGPHFENVEYLQNVDHFENLVHLQKDPENHVVLKHEEKDGIPLRENSQIVKKDSQPIHQLTEVPEIQKTIKREETGLIKQPDKIENTPIDIIPLPLKRKINTEKVEKSPAVFIKEIRNHIQHQPMTVEAEIIPLPLENTKIAIETNQENNGSIFSQTTESIEIVETRSAPDIITGEVTPPPKQALSSFDQVLIKAQMNDAPPYEVFEEKLFNEIKFLIGNEKRTATISMDPPELGKIEVEVVQVNEKTHVLFRVDTENIETKALIENSFSKLTEQFSVNGMVLGDLSVTQEDFSQTHKKSPEANYLTFSSKEENVEGEKEIIKTPSSLHLLDLYV